MTITAGIDVCSTYAKAVLFDDEHTILARAMLPTGFRLAEVARQVYEAARIIAPEGVEITYMLSVGPAFVGEDWPAPLLDFVRDPATTAVIVSFGTWQAAPPPAVEDLLHALAEWELQEAIRGYLAPMVDLGLPQGPALWLRPSVDLLEANELLVRANALIEPIALELDVRTDYVTDGTDEWTAGRSAIRLDGAQYPLRNDDPTHYCPASALLMARAALLAEGLVASPPTAADVAALLSATDGQGFFRAEGCEPLATT